MYSTPQKNRNSFRIPTLERSSSSSSRFSGVSSDYPVRQIEFEEEDNRRPVRMCGNFLRSKARMEKEKKEDKDQQECDEEIEKTPTLSKLIFDDNEEEQEQEQEQAQEQTKDVSTPQFKLSLSDDDEEQEQEQENQMPKFGLRLESSDEDTDGDKDEQNTSENDDDHKQKQGFSLRIDSEAKTFIKPKLVEQDYDELLERVKKQKYFDNSKICPNQKYEKRCADKKTAGKSQQGTVYLDCPELNVAWKHTTAKRTAALHNGTLKHDLTLLERACKIHSYLESQFPKNSADVLKSTMAKNIVPLEGEIANNCSYCFSERQGLELNIMQKKVKGSTLKMWLSNLLRKHRVLRRDSNVVKAAYIDKPLDRIIPPEDVINVLNAILQAIGIIAALHRAKLYHNDPHGDNFMVSKNTETDSSGGALLQHPASIGKTDTLIYKIGTLVYEVDCDFILKVLDYGTMTFNYQLDKNYKPPLHLNTDRDLDIELKDAQTDENTELPFPFLDLCHFLKSVSVYPPIEYYLYSIIKKDKVCELFGDKNSRDATHVADASVETAMKMVTNMINERQRLIGVINAQKYTTEVIEEKKDEDGDEDEDEEQTDDDQNEGDTEDDE